MPSPSYVKAKLRPSVREALQRYAAMHEIKLEEAAAELITAGLRVPTWVGGPRPTADPMDSLLGPIIHPGALSKEDRARWVEAVQPEHRTPIGTWSPREEEEPALEIPDDGSLPILGFAEVDALLQKNAAQVKRERKEAATAGKLDKVFDGLTDFDPRVAPTPAAEPVETPPAPASGGKEGPFGFRETEQFQTEVQNADAQLHAIVKAEKKTPKPASLHAHTLLTGLLAANEVRGRP